VLLGRSNDATIAKRKGGAAEERKSGRRERVTAFPDTWCQSRVIAGPKFPTSRGRVNRTGREEDKGKRRGEREKVKKWEEKEEVEDVE
jgi:hypothetical protein